MQEEIHGDIHAIDYGKDHVCHLQRPDLSGSRAAGSRGRSSPITALSGEGGFWQPAGFETAVRLRLATNRA